MPRNETAFGHLYSCWSWAHVRPKHMARFRKGMVGDENVLTVEAFFGLEMLPRQFATRVLEAVQGAPALEKRLELLRSEIEEATFDILPFQVGDHEWKGDGKVGVKPDVIIETQSVLAALEAKIGNGSFNQRQVPRQYAVVQRQARLSGKLPLLIAVLPRAPKRPMVQEAREQLAKVVAGMRGTPRLSALEADLGATLGWLTWSDLAGQVRQARTDFRCSDPSTLASIDRLARFVESAVTLHTTPRSRRPRATASTTRSK